MQGQRGSNSGGGAVTEQLYTQVRGARRLLADLEVLSKIAIDTLAKTLRSTRCHPDPMAIPPGSMGVYCSLPFFLGVPSFVVSRFCSSPRGGGPG